MPQHWYEGTTDDGKGATSPPSSPTPPERDAEAGKGDDKEAMRRLGEQRDAAREEARKTAEERDALLQEKQQRDAADTKATEDAAAKRGEFETLATKREQERDTARNEVTRLTAENDQLRTALTTGLDEEFGKLPDSVQKLWKGDDSDVLGRFTFLHDADVQKLVTELAEKGDGPRGAGPNPKPGDNGNVDPEAARKSQAALYTNW